MVFRADSKFRAALLACPPYLETSAGPIGAAAERIGEVDVMCDVEE
jgi:hypothetical protein